MLFCYFVIISPFFFRLAQSFFRGRFLNFVNVFSLFCYYLPLENGVVLYLSKLESPLNPRMLCANFCWNWPSRFLEDFQILSMYFRYFVIISPWKIAWPFIWTILNPLHPRMAQRFWRRRWKCEKFTDGQTDDGQQVIRKLIWDFSSGELKREIFT